MYLLQNFDFCFSFMTVILELYIFLILQLDSNFLKKKYFWKLKSNFSK